MQRQDGRRLSSFCGDAIQRRRRFPVFRNLSRLCERISDTCSVFSAVKTRGFRCRTRFKSVHLTLIVPNSAGNLACCLRPRQRQTGRKAGTQSQGPPKQVGEQRHVARDPLAGVFGSSGCRGYTSRLSGSRLPKGQRTRLGFDFRVTHVLWVRLRRDEAQLVTGVSPGALRRPAFGQSFDAAPRGNL